MTSQPPSYHGYRFPPAIISHAVWVYHRFGLSFRDVEDLLAERGVSVTYESIRQWCICTSLREIKSMMGARDASEAGEPVNHKRVARLYTEAGLRVRRRRRKKVSSPIANR